MTNGCYVFSASLHTSYRKLQLTLTKPVSFSARSRYWIISF